ncbi:DUF3566 domain-containing protein [Streptomyces sp. NPDC088935]|uniref:DUF3566 domain-containing protein n=1 Tax=Streptomyces sp. NPDC088935 TaxID=3365916 RepID=UPI0038256C41
MSGATGAGSAGTPTGTETGGGGRGSAARATDSHTTQLRKIDDGATDSHSGSSSTTHGSQGGTVTDTRGQRTQQAASPLPGERQPQQPGGPYHPPQAYQTQGGNTSAVRRPRTGARTTPRVRKARLRVSKADPWSVMKVSFLLSIALGICTIVASAVLWMVMDAMGVFSTVGGTIAEATGSNESNGFDLQSFLSLPNVLLFTTVIAVIDVVLATALATLGAFIYNLSAGFVGGVELTLAEDE